LSLFSFVPSFFLFVRFVKLQQGVTVITAAFIDRVQDKRSGE